MARIDAAQGQLPGTRQGIGPARVANPGGIIAAGVRQFAEARERREDELAAEAEAEQRAKNRVVLAEQTARFREDVDAEYASRAEKYDGSTDNFAREFHDRLSSRKQEFLATIPEGMAEEAELRLGQVENQYRLTALKFQRGQQRAYTLNGISQVEANEVRAVSRDASALDLAWDNVDAAIDAAPEDLQPDLRREGRQRLGLAALDWYADNAPEMGLDELASGRLSAYLQPEQATQARRGLEREIERRRDDRDREDKRQKRDAAIRFSTEIDDIERLQRTGLPVSRERYDRLVELGTAAGKQQADAALIARDVSRDTETLRQMPLADAIAAVTNIREGVKAGAPDDRDTVIRLEAAQRVVAGMQEALRDDPLQFAKETRGAVPELDLRDPIGSLKQRMTAAEEVAEHYGVPVRYFTDDELGRMRDVLRSTPEAKGQFVAAMSQVGAPFMLAELMPKEPELVHLAGVQKAKGSPGFVRDALAGQQLREREGFKSHLKYEARAPVVEAAIGDALQLRPGVLENAIASADLAYDARADRMGTDQFSADLYQQALFEALGGVTAARRGQDDRGGVIPYRKRGQQRTVWLPPGYTALDFQQSFDDLGDEFFARQLSGVPHTAYGRKIDMSEVRKGFPVAQEPGVYQIDIGTPESPSFLRDESGDYLVFRINPQSPKKDDKR